MTTRLQVGVSDSTPPTDLDIRLHAINLAVAHRRETIQLRRDDPRRATYETLVEAQAFAAWINDGTLPPEPPNTEGAASAFGDAPPVRREEG